jgi:hypothetical protein
MKYMLMMNVPKTAYETFGAWPKDALKAHIAWQLNFDKTLRASGMLVSAEGLASPQEAKIVRAGKNGEPVIDASFPESKEYLAGYWIVEVENAQQAYALAAKASSAPGPNGAPLNMPIEVREVPSGPPKEYLPDEIG